MKPTRKKIQCVEDRDTADLIGQGLINRGYEVRVAYDGKEALACILRDSPDLVLAGVNLHSMSGFELLKRLMSLGSRFDAVPFILLTDCVDRDSQLKGWECGVDDCVTKPVDLDVLAALIAARLARTAHADSWPQQARLGKRELETLTWAARGKTSAEIALILGLSKRTVDFHIDNARCKLGVATRIQAAIKAATCQLIEP